MLLSYVVAFACSRTALAAALDRLNVPALRRPASWGLFAAAFLILLSAALVFSGLSWDDPAANQELYANRLDIRTGWLYAASLLLLTVLLPIGEELVFRGLLLRFFESRWGWLRGALLTSVLFGFLHTDLFFTMALFGFVFSLLQRYAGSILFAILLHISWNTFSLLLLA